MTQPQITEDSPGTDLFPEYRSLYDLIYAEVRGLTDEQVDFESSRWEWSKWSIRRQLSHMSSLIYRWLLLRWGDTLFPDGDHGVDDVGGIADSDFDRRMDETRYWELSVIMDRLKAGIDLVQRVLKQRDVAFLRSQTYERPRSDRGWQLMEKAHPSGILPSDDPDTALMTLEATMRHIYFEETTHLYNIQRLKRAQGLPTVVEVPKIGYWVVDGWDRSEP